jgi:hypothetical protein
VWDILRKQKLLSPDSLDDNMSLSRQAWTVAAPEPSFDDEGELFVFGSDKDTTSLADEAARRWVNANLLVD